MSNISYDRETVLTEIQDCTKRQLPRLADHYMDEAEAFRSVFDQANGNEAKCRVAQAAREMCKMHSNKDDAFSTDVYMAIVFHTLRVTRSC